MLVREWCLPVASIGGEEAPNCRNCHPQPSALQGYGGQVASWNAAFGFDITLLIYALLWHTTTLGLHFLPVFLVAHTAYAASVSFPKAAALLQHDGRFK